MKTQIFVFTVIALMMLLPLTYVVSAKDDGNSLNEKITEMRNNLRERFMNETSFRENLIQQVKNCVGEDTEECNATRENATEIVKGVMGNVCDKSDEKLDELKQRIDNNEKLTGEEKDTLKQALDTQKQELDDICSQIEGANSSEVKDLAQQMKHLILETKVKFEIARGLVYGKRIGLIIERAEHLETRLDNIVEKMNASNCSTNISSLTAEFKADISDARTNYNASVDLWQQFKESVKNNETNTELLREAQAKMHLAELDLKEAHTVLKEIIVEVRDCKVDLGEKGNVTLPIENNTNESQ